MLFVKIFDLDLGIIKLCPKIGVLHMEQKGGLILDLPFNGATEEWILFSFHLFCKSIISLLNDFSVMYNRTHR